MKRFSQTTIVVSAGLLMAIAAVMMPVAADATTSAKTKSGGMRVMEDAPCPTPSPSPSPGG